MYLSLYAEQSALKDKRILGLPNCYFLEWSFITSYGDVAAQDVHVDVPANNFQFGVILQVGDACTVVMERHDSPDTAEDLLEYMWGINSNTTHLIQFPDSLKQLLIQTKISTNDLFIFFVLMDH